MSLHHRTQHKMGHQGFNTDPRDEIINVETFDNKMSSRIYISSDDKQDGTYSDADYFSESSIVKRGVSALGIESIDILWCIPNVNSNNNVISYSDFDLNVFTVSLDINNYITIDELYTEIITKMNSQLPGDPMRYEINLDCSVTLINDDAIFQFNNCLFINNGDSLHGLYYTELVSEIKSIPYLLSTSYIDVISDEILNGQIAQSSYSKQQIFNTTQHLARIQTDDVSNLELPRNIFKDYIKINFIPYRHRSLQDLRIKLLDQFGNILWSQSFTDLNNTQYELKNLKYNIVLNAVF